MIRGSRRDPTKSIFILAMDWEVLMYETLKQVGRKNLRMS